MWRQGDLLIKKVEKLPAKLKKRDGLVLVEGEATGHAHRLTFGEVYETNDGPTLFFNLTKPAALVHEEHATIDFEPGIYEVVRQREYDPFEGRNSWVAD